jgi:hypothetical protein
MDFESQSSYLSYLVWGLGCFNSPVDDVTVFRPGTVSLFHRAIMANLIRVWRLA